MEYFVFPVYGLLAIGIGLFEVVLSIYLNEEKIPDDNPIWMFIRAFFLSVASANIVFSLLYNPVLYRGILVVLLSFLGTFMLFMAFAILKKPYYYYSALAVVILSVGLTPFFGILSIAISILVWIISTLLLFMFREKIKLVYPKFFDEVYAVLIEYKIYLIGAIIAIVVALLRVHGIVLV